ncbi:MAG: type III-B CRISPR module RAMP protein Cmr4 [bacterium]|nr:type III-B CRISPR module RAMP protein Cmr4 [bacterium]
MNTSQLFLITNHTNLHVGAGNSSQGVIDNLVQRDHVNSLPAIYSSSLKGALREFFTEGPDKATLSTKVVDVFGSKPSGPELIKGKYVFHDGILLSYPVRSNKKPFFNATAPMVFKRLLENIDLLNFSLDDKLMIKLKAFMIMAITKGCPTVFSTACQNLKIEEFSTFHFQSDTSLEFNVIKTIFGDNLVMFNDEDFMALTDDYSLPVIARNQLENGQSNNLFYEQVVPRETRFYFFATKYDSTIDLATCINSKKVQLGANGSIGYGLCSIKQFPSSQTNQTQS